MNDTWQKLLWRLQAVANNNAYGGCSGVALIHINLIRSNGTLIGWYKPQRTPLEPKSFDISAILKGQRRFKDWSQVIGDLQKEKGQLVDRVLVVLDNKPVGWL